MQGDLHPIFQSIRISSKYTLNYFDKIQSVNVSLERRLSSLKTLRKETMKQIELTLNERFPNDTLIDSQNPPADLSNHSDYWLINTLDGSDNILFNLPLFALVAARYIDNECHTVCVYDPLRDECYSAIKGRGAFINQNRIRFSKRKTNQLIFAIETSDLSANAYPPVYRRLGCESLSIAYCCHARLDGCIVGVTPTNQALELLITEAGGRSQIHNTSMIVGHSDSVNLLYETLQR